MISLTRKSDYALVAVAGMATGGSERASARELSERLRLPLPALRNILKELAQHGVVEAQQGSRGGYRLARSPEAITVAEVVEAIEGAAQLAPCCEPTSLAGGGACRLESSCVIKSSVRSLHGRLIEVLRGTTIRDLMEGAGRASERGSGRTHGPAPAGAPHLTISTGVTHA